MDQASANYKTVDEYMAGAPLVAQPHLLAIRQLVLAHVPKETVETIAWGMPTYRYHGNLVHFAFHKKHLGFYAGVGAVQQFANQLKGFHTSKGTLQFPYAEPLPIDLILEMLTFCICENKAAGQGKASLR